MSKYAPSRPRPTTTNSTIADGLMMGTEAGLDLEVVVTGSGDDDGVPIGSGGGACIPRSSLRLVQFGKPSRQPKSVRTSSPLKIFCRTSSSGYGPSCRLFLIMWIMRHSCDRTRTNRTFVRAVFSGG